MKKRLKFECWQCHKEYSLLCEVQGDPKLIVECPFCEHEAVVDLAPWRGETVTILRETGGAPTATTEALNLPDTLPTRARTADDQADELEE